MTERLLADLESSSDKSQSAMEMPARSTNSLTIVQTTPSSRQLYTGEGASAKKFKVTLKSVILHFIFNMLCLLGISSEEERASNSWRSGSGEINRAGDS